MDSSRDALRYKTQAAAPHSYVNVSEGETPRKTSKRGSHHPPREGSVRKVIDEDNAFKNVIQNGHQDELDNEQLSIVAVKDNLTSGKEEQVFFALFETQQLLSNCREYAIHTLVPIICENLCDWGDGLKVSAAEALAVAVKSSIPTSLAKIITKTAYKILRESNDQAMHEIWGGILVATLPGADWSTAKIEDLLDFLEHRFAESEDTSARKLTARILGSLAACSQDDKETKRKIIHRAKAIASDKNTEVRGMVAESLSFIGASVQIAVVEKDLWPCILSLVSDDDARIHAVSMRAISYITAAHREAHPRSILYTKLAPSVLQRECIAIQRHAAADQRTIAADIAMVLEINAQIFGELLYSCRKSFADDGPRKESFKAFLAMATCNSPVVRKCCAFNMPAVSLCLARKHGKELSFIAEFLSRDPDVETRWTLAGGIHQTARMLASNDTVSTVFKTVQALLQDPNALVRTNTLAHFQELIAELAKHSRYDSTRKLTPLFENLQLLGNGNWRTQELLATQLELAAPLIPPPALKHDVLPMLYQMTEEGSFLVRKAAMSAVATAMRYIPDVTERDREMYNFRVRFARASAYTSRIAFIDAAQSAVKIFSSCLFRDTFGVEVLKLANDVVPNVRVRLGLLLPQIATACKEMDEFYTAVDLLKEDEDMDVKESMESIDRKIQIDIDRGRNEFELDMNLEEEEQDLYSRHLLAQKEVHKRKHNYKRRPGALLGKAAKGLHSGAGKSTVRSVSVAGQLPGAVVGDTIQVPRNSATAVRLQRRNSLPDSRTSGLRSKSFYNMKSTRSKPSSKVFDKPKPFPHPGKVEPTETGCSDGSPTSSKTSTRAVKGWRKVLSSPRDNSQIAGDPDKEEQTVA